MTIEPENAAEFPSAEELAEIEGDSVPAAGFALFPEDRVRSPVAIVTLVGAAVIAAGVGLYRGLRGLTKAG